MIKPKAVKNGDWVGVVAPSDAVERRDVEAGVKILKSWGLRVKIAKHVYAKVGDFSAGTPEERIEDLKEMLEDPKIRVVWAAGGGYAATEILPVFNREVINNLKNDLKWFVGYSDVCLILNALTSFRMVSVVGPNLGGLAEWDKKSREALRNILFGEAVTGIDENAKWRPVFGGITEGSVIVSNLETLVYSFGTRFDPIMYGQGNVILIVEELNIDKSLMQRLIDVILGHKRADRIKGLVIGRLENIKEVEYPKWGKKVTAEQLIKDRVKKLKIPLAFLDDFGHPEWGYGILGKIGYIFSRHRFLSIVNGVAARLTVDEKSGKLEYLEEIVKPDGQSVQTQPGFVRDNRGDNPQGGSGGEKGGEQHGQGGSDGREGPDIGGSGDGGGNTDSAASTVSTSNPSTPREAAAVKPDPAESGKD